ncbi:MAG TPA: DUF255 domain-containing protein, partial [Thermopetrobacter sp.]|nr:DUF255 domain-containing protein [Thermopetrobacter sp.]
MLHSGMMSVPRQLVTFMLRPLFLASLPVAITLSPALVAAAAGAEPASPARSGGWRLATAASPYLRGHADDPVAWRPWTPATLAEARRTGRPILLSIGYSTCYWCHVLQREVFRDAETARFINRHFLPVLVDRERRPDIDAYFQEAMRLLEGRGGWPNNVFLTPEGRPFLAFGYVRRRHFRRLAERVAAGWRGDAATLRAEARRIDAVIRARLEGVPSDRRPAPPPVATLRRLARETAALFDPFHGGLMAGPKHFRQPLLTFLLHMSEVHGVTEAGAAVRTTLEAVLRAGVRDHAGGGFFRYATDPEWNIPHYEKMLPDQALLALLLLRAWRAGGGEALRRAAEETLDYAIADLAAGEGAFFAARDAGGAGGEGGYYLFSRGELKTLLGAADAEFMARVSVTIPRGEMAGMILPALSGARNAAEIARARRLFVVLRRARARRAPPARDEKIITAWNGMMIEALATSAMATGNARHAARARRAARFILRAMRDGNGDLLRIRHRGRAGTPAMLDDHAWLIRALLALYDLDDDVRWLAAAERIAGEMLSRFRLGDGRLALSAARPGLLRVAPWRDGARPAAQAAALVALSRLARRDGDARVHRAAVRLARALAGRVTGDAVFGAGGLLAIDELLRGESGAVQHAGGGVVRARVTALAGEDAPALRVALRIREGWHVNADPAGMKWLVPTRIEVVDADGVVPLTVRWPAPVRRRLSGVTKPLPVHEGRIVVSIRPRRAPRPPLVVR